MAIENKYVSDPMNNALALSLDSELTGAVKNDLNAETSTRPLAKSMGAQSPAGTPSLVRTPPRNYDVTPSPAKAAESSPLKKYSDIHNTTQITAPTPISEIRVGGHYMVEYAKQPLSPVNPDLYIWKVIGVMGTRVIAVPAYSFKNGDFVDKDYPRAASFVATERRDFSGEQYDVAQFFDANGTMSAIEEMAAVSGTPRQKVLTT